MPAQTTDGLKFWGCCREFEEGWHDVFVPDIPDSAGAGGSVEEAMSDATHKLSCEVKSLEENTGAVPRPSPYKDAEEKAQSMVQQQLPLQPVKRWWMVELQVDFGLVKELTEEKLQALCKEYSVEYS